MIGNFFKRKLFEKKPETPSRPKQPESWTALFNL